MRAAFLDTDRNRLRRNGLTEAELAVENRDHRRINHALHDLIGNQQSVTLPCGIARHAGDAMAVVAGQIGIDETATDPRGFVARRTERCENAGDECRELCGIDLRAST